MFDRDLVTRVLQNPTKQVTEEGEEKDKDDTLNVISFGEKDTLENAGFSIMSGPSPSYPRGGSGSSMSGGSAYYSGMPSPLEIEPPRRKFKELFGVPMCVNFFVQGAR